MKSSLKTGPESLYMYQVVGQSGSIIVNVDLVSCFNNSMPSTLLYL